jgi:putative addiction module killer protein
MVEVRQTRAYRTWFAGIRDRRTRARSDVRIRMLSLGHAGHAKSVGGGVSELRLSFGPGYRVYFCRRGTTVVILLAGGDKSTQSRDIEQARALAEALEE